MKKRIVSLLSLFLLNVNVALADVVDYIPEGATHGMRYLPEERVPVWGIIFGIVTLAIVLTIVIILIIKKRKK